MIIYTYRNSAINLLQQYPGSAKKLPNMLLYIVKMNLGSVIKKLTRLSTYFNPNR